MPKKYALVDGACGHTGSFLVNELIKNDWHVVATDLDPVERKKLMQKEQVFKKDLQYLSIDLPEVEFIPSDLTKKETLYHLFDHDFEFNAIFHPASLYDYFAEIDLLRKINVGGIENLLEVMVDHYVNNGKVVPHFLHWSTCGVYGEPKYKKDAKGFILPADETTGFDPPNNYSLSKQGQEFKLKMYAEKYNLDYTIIRPAPIMGEFQQYGMYHIFYMSYLIGTMPLPHIFPAQKKLMMPMIHVEDLARAAVFLANNPQAYGEAYNLVCHTSTQEDWLEFIFQEMGLDYVTIPIWWPFYKIFAKWFHWMVNRQNKQAKKYRIRPKIDLSMADYVCDQYYFSNEKIKALGFKFLYEDPFVASRRTIRWYLDHRWFEEEYSLNEENPLINGKLFDYKDR